MSVEKAVGLGITGNEISKKITGTSEVSPERTAIATGAGVALGAAASGALIVTGIASAPVTVPLSIATGAVAFLASLFD